MKIHLRSARGGRGRATRPRRACGGLDGWENPALARRPTGPGLWAAPSTYSALAGSSIAAIAYLIGSATVEEYRAKLEADRAERRARRGRAA